MMPEREIVEAALRESELRYRALVNSIDDGFCVCQMLFDATGQPRDYRFLEVNRTFEHHTGLVAPVGRTALELVPDLERHWIELYGKVALTGEPLRIEQGSDAMGGRWFDVSAFRIGDAGSLTFGILFTDVTKRKRAEDRLHRTQARLESALEAGVSGTFYWDTRRDVIMTDANMMGYFSLDDRALHGGVPMGELLPAIHPDDRVRVRRAMIDATRNRRSYQLEHRVHHSDGSIRWLSVRGGVECDPDGEVIGLAGFTLDVTERKHAEDRLRHSEERYRAIVEGQTEMVCRFRPDGTILFVNGAYARARGSTPEDMAGENFWNWVSADDRPHVQTMLEGLRAGDPEVRIENRFDTAGGLRWMLWTNRGLAFGSNGRPTEIQCSGIDITDRKRAEEALAESEASLRNANRMKDEFLATLSHELRTPLNAVLGWAHMLRSGNLTPESTDRALDSIERNARVQSQLVDDLLDMSRIVSGKLRIRLERVDLAAIVTAAVEAVLPAARSKGLVVQVATDGPGPIVHGDADRLQQTVWNLLSNAIKFTPGGGRVDVTVRQGTHAAEMVVTDTGEGIAPEFLPFVFDRFRQADATTTRHHGGLGIGLAIVRYLTEAHGGSVTAQSDGVNLGATFTVRLPPVGALPPQF